MIYDPFQQQAIEYINQGYSVIVSAPTGAGKTVIAEHVIQDCINRGTKVVYTAPIKALSNQKYREFQDETQSRVGILTGDITLNADAPVLIMTTEIFRNKVLEERESLKDYSWIIFDEIHYLDDYERGSVWEESLIFLPEHMKFLGLSATIPNIDELAKWVETIHHKPIKVVKETKRPVPLHFYYQCQGMVFENIKAMADKGFRTHEHRHYRGGRLPRSVKIKANRTPDLIRYLHQEKMLPCIYFAFGRRRTEQLAEEMVPFDFLTEEERQNILKLYHDLCQLFDLKGEDSAQKILPFISRGIGYHHAGMLPTLKEVVERLFTSKLLKVIFTTETFALGINMPAKTVIFDELKKFYGRSFAMLRTRDFYQMAGRAGRRSIDQEGFVFCRINPHFTSPEEVHMIVYNQPEKIHSQFNASYATLLNLYKTYGENLYDVYPKSFHYFQVNKMYRKRALHYMKAKVDILKELRYIVDGELTEKGTFAANVYSYEMILSELYEVGTLERLSLQQLGIMALAVVYEPRKDVHKPELNKQAEELENLTRRALNPVHRLEKIVGLRDLSKRCYFHLTASMEAWIGGGNFQSILKHTEADEGEVVRYIRMSIQILREIADAPVSSQLRDKIYKLIKLINRDVVDSEKQLRS